ncbi:hypothetical protein G6F37_011640 [Rhizopus arrhizus]|nr:hypothetical protein G6F38_012019 [Rhizopus arrhizus]KAG1148248.1 hypothetical protein G6F37_011640 [Rhizopus arrhizus]
MNRLTIYTTNQIGKSSVTIASSSPATAAVKRRKKIMPKGFKGLSDYKQAVLLVDSCDTNRMLDFRQSLIIPQKLQAVTNKIMKKLHLLLTPKLKTEEHPILKQISQAKTMNDFTKIVEFISIVQSNDELVFIKMLVNKLVILYKYGHLKKEHNEC